MVAIWTREACFEEAKKYITRKEFQNNCPTAYKRARENKWLDDYIWFVNGHLRDGDRRRKWNYETCYFEALKYKTRSEFQYGEGSSRAYKTARDNGWLDDYTWFEQKQQPSGYWTYERCYEEAMKYSVLREYRKKSASAYVISLRNGWLPSFEWLELKKVNWTYKQCYNLAATINSRSEFKALHKGAYYASLRNEWINDYTWFKEKYRYKYWTRERCYQEAKKHSTKTEFSKNSCAYSIACKKGWITDYEWMVDKRIDIIDGKIDCVYYYYFSETNTIYVGRTINKKERDYAHIFMAEKDSVARYAKEHGLRVPPMIVLEDSLTLKEGQAKEHYWKKYYQDNGFNILNMAATGVGIGSLGAIGSGKWTQKACYEEARKYSSRTEFKKACGSAYSAAFKKGWIKDYLWLGSKREPWTYEKCYKEAMKYEYRMEFVKNAYGAYNAACKHGWIKMFDWFKQPISARLKWTYGTCYEAARQFRTKTEFDNVYPGAMNVARKNGWLKDYTWFVSGRKKR